MAVKKILPVKKQTTETIVWDVNKEKSKCIKILNDLTDTLNSTDRFWLTTTEIGIKERGIAMKFRGNEHDSEGDDIHYFFNPSIQKRDKAILFREVCPIDGKEYFVPRFTRIDIVYQNFLGEIKGLKLNEAASIVMCQALDALNTIYACDYGLEIIPEFDTASKEDQEEVLAEYVKSLSERFKALDDELSNDSEGNVKQVWNGAKYIKGVADGSIETYNTLSNRKKKRLKKLIDSIKHLNKHQRG